MDAATRDALRPDFPAVEHPVVRTHPETGRKTLYVNRAFTQHIVGLDPDESAELLELPVPPGHLPRVPVPVQLAAGDVAFWDNRSTQHYACSDYFPQRRVMERITIDRRPSALIAHPPIDASSHVASASVLGEDGKVSRRALLVGGGVAAGGLAATGFAAALGLQGRVAHAARVALGACDIDSPPVPQVAVDKVTGTIPSAVLGADVEYVTWRAPGRSAQRLVLCLHGRGGVAERLPEVSGLVAHLLRADPTIVVSAVQGPADGYWRDRALGRWGAALVEDLMPALRDRVGAAGKTAVAGWSMGGYGSLLLGQRHPDAVAAVAVCAPAIYASYDDAEGINPASFDDAADFAAHDVVAGVGQVRRSS